VEVSNNYGVEASDPIIQWAYINCARLAHEIDRCDCISMDFGEWRFNLRASNTEPLLRLNVETRGDSALMEQRRNEILELIR